MTTSGTGECQAIVLIGFGGPNSLQEVRPFLDRVLAGRPVSRERYEDVVHHYEALGGRSPYNELTMRQAAALREFLDSSGGGLPVVVGFRNTPPYIENALQELARNKIGRALGFILAAHRCEASWQRYQNDISSACARLGRAAPTIEYPLPWHSHRLFIEAVADRARAALARIDDVARGRAELIFTAHSIPVAMAAGAPYVEQLKESAQLVARELGRDDWKLAFQSRSGSPREPWLEPDIGHLLRKLPRGAVAVVIPLGFLCDHIEVLYDLDIEAASIARDHGVRMERAATVNAHPSFIRMIATIAKHDASNRSEYIGR
jgi:protoporphyrin/coproporphyrin ferrochelatase